MTLPQKKCAPGGRRGACSGSRGRASPAQPRGLPGPRQPGTAARTPGMRAGDRLAAACATGPVRTRVNAGGAWTHAAGVRPARGAHGGT
jgi:hypothetical protein